MEGFGERYTCDCAKTSAARFVIVAMMTTTGTTGEGGAVGIVRRREGFVIGKTRLVGDWEYACIGEVDLVKK